MTDAPPQPRHGFSCGLMILFFVEKIVDPSKRVPTGHAGEFEF